MSAPAFFGGLTGAAVAFAVVIAASSGVVISFLLGLGLTHVGISVGQAIGRRA